MTSIDLVGARRQPDSVEWAPMTDGVEFQLIPLLTDLSAFVPPAPWEFGVNADGQAVQWPAGLMVPGSLGFRTAAELDEIQELHVAAVDRKLVRFRVTFAALGVITEGEAVLRYMGGGSGQNSIVDQAYQFAVTRYAYFDLEGRPIGGDAA